MKRSFLPFAVILCLIVIGAFFMGTMGRFEEANTGTYLKPVASQNVLPDSLPKNNLGIIIKDGASTQIDFIENTYTVYLWGLRDSTRKSGNIVIPFNLTQEEENRIRKEFYRLQLNELPDSVLIDDKVEMFPYIPTIITIHTNKGNKIIQFEYGKDYDDKRGYHIKGFLDLINKIVRNKPVVKDAPKSDVSYM